MAWRFWRGILGGSAAALLLLAPATAPLAQDNPPPAAQAKPAETPAKPPVKTAAKKPVEHPAKKIAAAKAKPPVKKLAETKKPTPKKTVAAAKKPAEPTKVTAAEAKPAETKSAAPSYTITSTHGGVTSVATRVVPLGAAMSMAMVTPESTPTPTPPAAPAPVAAEKPAAVAPVAVPAPRAAPAPLAAEKPVVVPVSLPSPAPKAAPAPAARPEVRPAVALVTPTIKDDTPAGKPDEKAAAAFVSKFLGEAFHIAKASDANSLQRRAQLAELFAGKMDVRRIAGFTTGDELSDATAEIQQRFRTILVSYLVETYYPQLELASDPGVRVETAAAEPLADGTAVVWTTFTKDGWGSQSVSWHLKPADNGFRIVDIFSAGASLVQMEHDTFQSVMRNGGLNELMAKLDARTKELASAATE